MMQRGGFKPPLSLRYMVSDFISTASPHPQTLSDESINRGLVCAHVHSIARTQKILTFMPQPSECRQQKHTQHAPSTKTECDLIHGWIKKKRKEKKNNNKQKRSNTQKSHQKDAQVLATSSHLTTECLDRLQLFLNLVILIKGEGNSTCGTVPFSCSIITPGSNEIGSHASEGKTVRKA